MSTLENLGLLVHKKRGDRGIRAVAKEIGISHATLSRVENGHLPDLENYDKICRWLGVVSNPVVQQNEKMSASRTHDVHFRKNPAVSQDTALALAQMILSAQTYLDDHQ